MFAKIIGLTLGFTLILGVKMGIRYHKAENDVSESQNHSWPTSFKDNFKKFTPLKLYLPSTIIKIEKSIRAISENLCWFPFLRNADLIAIMKSSLFVCIVY